MTTTESIRDAIEQARPNFALVTFTASVYQPWKTDRSLTKKTTNDADIKSGSLVVKKLCVLDKKVEEINTIVSRARTLHYTMTRSWSGRKVGIIPAEGLMSYSAAMRTYIQAFKKAVDEATDAWPAIVAEQAGRLNGTFRIEDYPTAEEFRNKFRLEVYVEPLPDYQDDRLSVPDSVVEDLVGTIEDQVKRRVDGVYRELFEAAMESVKDVARILAHDDPQRIRGSLMSNLKLQVEWLRKLNLTGDTRITGLAEAIERHLIRDAGLIRDDAKERAKVLNSARTIIRDMGNIF